MVRGAAMICWGKSQHFRELAPSHDERNHREIKRKAGKCGISTVSSQVVAISRYETIVCFSLVDESLAKKEVAEMAEDIGVHDHA